MKLLRIAGASGKRMLFEEVRIKYIVFHIYFDTVQVQSSACFWFCVLVNL